MSHCQKTCDAAPLEPRIALHAQAPVHPSRPASCSRTCKQTAQEDYSTVLEKSGDLFALPQPRLHLARRRCLLVLPPLLAGAVLPRFALSAQSGLSRSLQLVVLM